MKILIIHPKDPTTSFLSGIYKDLTNKTVITGGVTKLQMRKEIARHDRVICCGHGSPAGLFGVGQFNTKDTYIIDDSMVSSLKMKSNSLFIWCYASEFVNRHNLSGLNCSMFISSLDEGLYYNFWDVEDLDILIEESNYRFAEIVSKYINEPVDVLHKNVLIEYGELAKANPIALFNFKRIFISQPEPVMFPHKVFNIK